ncbi:MAG TPA: YXWGXW repeat-containing protein [Trinickia sp.]|jgi:hypothetical protein|uniref:YXWGXW repeat-containing protein n=1 Tax=Trinickia sp. TaxID=2571163 RepID=UPI002CF85352|nr:YXWGXW repeat-containing protein [Trinickia sp.]HTI16506.1 YXWGXW repeat-containing protein [Trinickia sp.]
MKVSAPSLMIRIALATAASMTIVASVSAQEVLIAPSAPPPVQDEAVPAPRAGYVWDHGHWRWEHGRYVWVRGHWEVMRLGHHWSPGHWAPRDSRWVWIPGHWS